MYSADLHKVWEVRPLKRRPDHSFASDFLTRIARHVLPIMRRRRWRVKLLSEFCHPKLLGLNVNRGAEIRLRLRRHGREGEFLSFEEVLDTMLHELCHMQRGPHDAEFYRLWDELRKEYEELSAKGMISDTAQPFEGHGRRLGGFSCQRQPSLQSIRQAALSSAEKRAKIGALLPSGPRRLGGNSEVMSALSPLQAAAMAAERRMHDDMWCGSHGEEECRDLGESSSDAPDLVVLSDACDSDVEILDCAGASTSGKRPRLEKAQKSAQDDSNYSSGECSVATSLLEAAGYSAQLVASEDTTPWECIVCTLLNKPLAPICEACELPRVRDSNIKSKSWYCEFCTLENNITDDRCLACNEWRYSRGPPVAMHCPNVGT